jgi:hypothetical protein
LLKIFINLFLFFKYTDESIIITHTNFKYNTMNKITSTIYLFFLMLLCLGFSQQMEAQTTYIWNSSTGVWTTATAWTPTRTTPAANDILVFNSGTSVTATAIPSQTIGKLQLSNNTTVNLQAGAAATILSISGGTTALSVDNGSALNINGTNTMTIDIATGSTASITGNMTFTTAIHKFTAADANGITFNSPSIFTQGTGCTGNVYGTALPANTVIFATGTTFVSAAGSNPFGLTQPASKVVFQTGSLFKVTQAAAPGMSGRTYANFEWASSATAQTSTGGSAFVCENLTITSGTLNINMTGTPGHTIKGNISVATGATLNFNPLTAGTINFSGAAPQTITKIGTGVLTFASTEAVVISNPTSVTFNQAQTISGSTIVNASSTLATTGALTLVNSPAINGSFQINQGGSASGGTWVYGSVGTLNFNNTSSSIAVGSDVFWPTTSGPFNVNVLGAGGVTINAAKTVLNDFSISSGAVVLNADVIVNNNTTVNSGSLTVSAGKNLTINKNLINNAGATAVVVENNANLIQGAATTTNSNVGSITVKRNSNALNRLDYTMWSSPVSDGTQTLAGFSPLTSQSPTSRFYIYDNTQGATGLYSSVSPTTPFATGTGYLIRMPNEDPAILGTSSDYYLGTSTLTYNGVFTGVPNNGDVTLNVTSGTYNAVGNPYPSTINADLFLSGNGITSNSDALYFWRKSNNSTTSSYATYTTAGGTANPGDPLSIAPDATIQVGQGFIAKSTSATLKFTNSMRTTNNGNKILKTKLVERNRIWLNLSSETTPISQMMVAYMTGATQGIDPAIDGSYINDSQTALNSLISNEEYVIQGRSLPFDGTDVVPLAFKTTTAGNFTIAIDHADGLLATAQEVYLVDSKTGTETNLKTSGYTFTAAAGIDNARFSLKYQKTLKVDAQVFNDNTVSVYKNNGTLYVNSGAVAIANIKVFDIQGRLIAERNNVKANNATISNLKATNQVLIVKVTGQDNAVVSKKVLD